MKLLTSITLLASMALATPRSLGRRQTSSSPLDVRIEMDGNSKVKAVLTNNGDKDLRLLKTGTFLDQAPVEKAKVYTSRKPTLVQYNPPPPPPGNFLFISLCFSFCSLFHKDQAFLMPPQPSTLKAPSSSAVSVCASRRPSSPRRPSRPLAPASPSPPALTWPMSTTSLPGAPTMSSSPAPSPPAPPPHPPHPSAAPSRTAPTV